MSRTTSFSVGGLVGIFFGQQMCAAYFVGVEEQSGIQVRTGAALAHQIGDTPGGDHKQGQRPFDPVNRRQLQRFDLASIL